MSQYSYQVKRLQHATNSRSHDIVRSTIENLGNQLKSSQLFKPAPYRARRGGSRAHDRHRYASLPKRTIYYDLAESFVDHSTNPLSSDLYKIRFKNAAKQWPNGRFKNYKEKLDKFDEPIRDIICTRTFSIVQKRKKNPETEEKKLITPQPTIVVVDPAVQEQKKKLADKQTDFYANFFGCERYSKISATNQIKKTNPISNSTKTFTSLVGENKEDQQC